MTTLETRTMYESGKLRITAAMHDEDIPGEDLLPSWDDDEGQRAVEEMRFHLHARDFQYVGMVVTIYYDDVEIVSDSLWGIEHGKVATVSINGWTGPGEPGDPITSDAWDMTFAEYGPPVTHDASGQPLPAPAPGTITGCSSLVSVIDEAVDRALTWAEAHGGRDMVYAVRQAARWIDPDGTGKKIRRFGPKGYYWADDPHRKPHQEVKGHG